MTELILLALVIIVVLLWVEPHAVVLTFHSVATKEDDVYTIRPRSVMRYFRLLKLLGYRPVSAVDLLNPPDAPRRSVVVTFDDGYRDNFHFILWLLSRDIEVTVFLPTAHLGQSNSWDAGNKRIMNPEEIAILAGRGVNFGSHGHHHRRFNELPAEQLEKDLLASREIIATIGSDSRMVAYPYGAYDEDVLKVAEKAGFSLGFTTIPRQVNANCKDNDYLQLGRISMRRGVGVLSFLMQLLQMRLRGWKQRLIGAGR